jgi:hypothetical protein
MLLSLTGSGIRQNHEGKVIAELPLPVRPAIEDSATGIYLSRFSMLEDMPDGAPDGCLVLV